MVGAPAWQQRAAELHQATPDKVGVVVLRMNTPGGLDTSMRQIISAMLASPVPVVTYVAGEKSDLKAGAKIIAFVKALPDGSFETSRVSVGRDGLTPPM